MTDVTDVLEPTDEQVRPQVEAHRWGARPEAAPEPGPANIEADDQRIAADDVLRGAAAVVNLGAAVIHFAYAQDHLSEQASHGAFFLAAGWAQLVLAIGLGLRARPQRAWAAACAAVNAGIVGVWLFSRTVGVPGSDAESVGFADLTSTGLEVAAVVLAAALLLGTLAAVRVPRPNLGAVGVATLLVGGLVTASVTPAVAGEHSHGDGGHDAAGGHAGMEGDHHGGATASDDWEQTRLDALYGYQDAETVEAFRQTNIDYLSEQLRTRSEHLRSLPEAEREAIIAEFAPWAVDNALEGENGASQGDEAVMHTHGPEVWQPIESAEDQAALQRQLQEAGTVIGQFPTAAEAAAFGYIQVTPYVPGIGAHYLHIGRLTDGEFVPAEPEMLLYNGNEPTSELVGLSYGMFAAEPPEGFVGPNDTWHTHPSLCTVGGTFVVGPDHTPEEMCASVGGQKGNGGRMQMSHLWQVPGWESPWGLFSGENPNLNIVTTDVGK